MNEKYCPNCKAPVSADICWNCGTKIENFTQDNNNNNNGNSNYQEYQQAASNFQNNPVDNSEGFLSNTDLTKKNGTSATITMLDWFKVDAISLLSLIPFIGGLATIIIYCILAFKANIAPSIRNRIKLNLLISAILIVLWVVVLVIILSCTARARSGLLLY